MYLEGYIQGEVNKTWGRASPGGNTQISTLIGILIIYRQSHDEAAGRAEIDNGPG